MDFPRLVPPTAQRIGDIVIELYSPGVGSEHPAGARYTVKVWMSDGSVKELRGDLVPFLTQQQINGQLAFLDTMRARAVAEIL